MYAVKIYRVAYARKVFKLSRLFYLDLVIAAADKFINVYSDVYLINYND